MKRVLADLKAPGLNWRILHSYSLIDKWAEVKVMNGWITKKIDFPTHFNSPKFQVSMNDS